MTTFVGIVCFCRKYGIGFEGNIPWNIKEDLQFFKKQTINNVVIMGKNTYMSIPAKHKPLPGRVNIVLSNKACYDDGVIFTNYADLELVLEPYKHLKFYVIGGEEIYRMFYDRMTTIYVTYIDKTYETDKYFPMIGDEFSLREHSVNIWSETEQCNYRFMRYDRDISINVDKNYLALAEKVLKQTCLRKDRTGTDTFSIFGEQISFEIDRYVPLLTTKRMAWKSCIEELLWFLRGDTDANILKKKNVNIWNLNSTREFLDKVGLSRLNEGDCGANYSFQWRFFGQDYIDCKTEYKKHTPFDQINNVVNMLKNDPYSRRIFLSAWNPKDLHNTVLPPCHVSAQFYVDETRGLSCHMYQRSCDVFLGLPFNIFSYTVLTYILAKKTNLTPKRLIISLGDTHVYANHVDQLKEQLLRVHLTAPVLKLDDSVETKDFDDITIDDFELIGYHSHPSIKATMSA